MIRTPEALRVRLFRGVNLPPNIPFVRAYQSKNLQEFIIESNRNFQLFRRGTDINDEVTGVYSEATELINPEKEAGTHFTFKDTGRFFDSFEIEVFIDGSFSIKADDTKENIISGRDFTLTESYGPLLGLNERHTTKLSRAILPFIIGEVRTLIFDS